MKKVFTLLLAEVKKLGATVVHADMQAITIAARSTGSPPPRLSWTACERA